MHLPFSLRQVSPASPAEEAGIQVGDSLVKFGHVQVQPQIASSELLQQVAQVICLFVCVCLCVCVCKCV
jgi:predicted metalloprotease with PDZ domain